MKSKFRIVVYPSTSGETYRVYVEYQASLKLLFLKPLYYWVTLREFWGEDFMEKDFYTVDKALEYVRIDKNVDVTNVEIIYRNPYGESL